MQIKDASGHVTKAIVGSANENLSTEDGFGDAEALRRAFRDPRYQTSASYRQLVADAIDASEAIKSAAPGATVLDGGQLNGRFQVTPRVTHDEAPDANRELSDHDREMIAKAEKHGL